MTARGFLNLIISCNFVNLFKVPTRDRVDCKSPCIDNVFINSDRDKATARLLESNVSDHKGLIVDICDLMNIENPVKGQKSRKINVNTLNLLTFKLSQESWLDVMKNCDVNEANLNFWDTLYHNC